MADRTLDLQTALSGLRRHRGILLAAAVLGGLLGIGSATLWPPMYTSSSLVLLPSRAADPDQMAELVKTDTRIAMSDAVLGRAAKNLRPRMSVEELTRHVQVSPATPLILEIQGRAEDPARAQEIAHAVAKANVTYVTESASSLTDTRRAQMTAREKELSASLERIEEQILETTVRQREVDPRTPQGRAEATALAELTAQQGSLVLEINDLQSQREVTQPSGGASIIQDPSPAKRAQLVGRYLGATTAGVLVALALAASAITLLTRRDRRLHFRDDIADAVGSPVIASVRTSARTSVASWISLLRDYTPSSVEAWTWRQALRQLMYAASASGVASQRGRDKMEHHPRSITVVTLSSDPRGLAAGPQLAAFAATAGLRTHLVAAQRHETAAALWAALSHVNQEDRDTRPGLSVDTRPLDQPQVDLTIVLVVLDRDEPELVDVPADTVVVLGLSAGSATAEELARVAMTVDEAGERIQGIVVTDPDNLDRTTGRLLQPDRVQQIPLPARSTGTPAPRHARDTLSTAGRRQG